ncbi:MAG: Glycosidase related protein [Candidatus Uhrbacteria bacterium GW2011_GWF2_39_13]|uniref:Glycosidase related protein n=1 Tax=Candidatus Uhrbacteria bacterium GW2011_GWF2_39_13 TaxID=1618995 RepID=A0A0G0Q0N6_9BACT|nr:MAG: Glycosidase related protein [Candidatus Uhrbacteria bacterium GW2011_GWF2_39_13]
MKEARNILKRYQGNPVMKPEDFHGIARIFNPSPVKFKSQTVLLVSVRNFYSETNYGETRVAVSDDGINFKLGEKPFINLESSEIPFSEFKNPIDNRCTMIDGVFYIVTPVGHSVFSEPFGILGKTSDFKKYELIDIISLPQNRGTSLFPEKIKGKYYRLDRPGAGNNSKGTIWISSSPDMIHWGCYRPLLSPGYRYWNNNKIGPTPPIKTDKGWLVIIHGVHIPASGPKYYIGAIMLDLQNPEKIIGKTNSYLLAPDEEYERHGACDNVVFPCGAIADYEDDVLRLYYGGADNCVCLAEGSLKEIVDACLNGY